jgi:hypothetical protein
MSRSGKQTNKKTAERLGAWGSRERFFSFYVNYSSYYYVTVAGVKRIAARVLGPRRFPVPYLASWYGMVA